jgi:hypothetical protein
VCLDPLTKKKLTHHLTALEIIRYDMEEDKPGYVNRFCQTKLGTDSLGVRRTLKSIFNHMVRLYDTDTIHKGPDLYRYLKTRKGDRRLRIVLD